MQEINGLVASCIESIAESYERRGAIPGLPTGFKDLDLLTSGLRVSDLVVIASLPGLGKTAFGLNIVDFVTTASSHGVAIFSGGMNAQRVVRRLMCSRARVGLSKVQDGFLKQTDFPNLTNASTKLMGRSIFIEDSGVLTLDELKLRAKNAKEEHDIRLIVVDNVHRLHSHSRRAIYSLEVDRTEVMAKLKTIAEELGVPVLALSRLTVRGPHAAEQRMAFQGYQEAESIDGYADVIGLLERPETDSKNKASRDESYIEIRLTIVKNENGPIGEMNMRFQKEYLRFET